MSFKILEVSAQDGDVEAQYKLGEMYYYGFLNRPNLAQARKWLQLAADQGNQKAQGLLDSMRKKKQAD